MFTLVVRSSGLELESLTPFFDVIRSHDRVREIL
jgi:hypothetical protein